MRIPRTIAAGLVALTLLVAACGDDGDSDEAGDTTEPTEEETTTTTTSTTTAPPEDTGAEGAAAVDVGETDLGEVLVDAEGFTLYVFETDEPGTSNCNEGCIEQWPAAEVEEGFAVGEGLDESIFGTISRDDGTVQLAVNDFPLYRYSSDSAPGDTQGQGVGGVWWAVAPDGTAITG